MKRYEPSQQMSAGDHIPTMERDEAGDYVEYAEYAKAKEALDLCYQWLVDHDEIEVLNQVDKIMGVNP